MRFLRIPSSIAFILLAVFMDVVGLGLVYPILPALVNHLAPTLSHAGQARAYGALVSMYAALQFLFVPLLGALSDTYGRRSLLLVSLLGLALGYVGMALSPGLALLFVARALCGLSGSSLTVANAYIADVAESQHQAHYFGWIGAAVGVGFVAGPALGGLLGELGFRAPLWAAAGMALLNWLYGYFVLPESLPAERRAKFSLRRANPLASVLRLLRQPALSGLATTFFLGSMAVTTYFSMLVLYGQANLGWSPSLTGLVLAGQGVSLALVQGIVLRRAQSWWGEPATLLSAPVVGALAFGVLAWTHQIAVIAVLVLLQAYANAMFPLLQARAAKLSSESEQGSVQGSLVALRSLSAIVAPSLGARLFAWGSQGRGMWHLPGAPFLLAAGCMVVAACLVRAKLGLRAASGAPGLGVLGNSRP